MLAEIYNYNENNTKVKEKTNLNIQHLNDIFENKRSKELKENLEIAVLKKETFFDKILKK